METSITNRQSFQEVSERFTVNWPEVFVPETKYVIAVERLALLIAKRTNRVSAGFDLTPAGFETLVTLRSSGEPYSLTPVDLIRSIIISSGGMTKVLNALEKSGYVTRHQNGSDKRSKIVSLSEEGKRVIEECMGRVAKSDQKIVKSVISKREFTRLSELTFKFLDEIDSD